MPPTIYIHMGQNKTGTTSLQRFCHQYREELKTVAGLYYPPPRDRPYFRHMSFFPFKREYGEQMRREMEISGCTRLLLSTESLFPDGLSNDDLRAIRDSFPGSEIFIIIYIRRLDDYCRSHYRQWFKSARVEQEGYAAYLSRMTARGANFAPSRLLRQCEEQVGRDHLLARIYDRGLLKNGNIVEDFFDLIGIALPDSLERERQDNPSLPGAALPYMTGSLMTSSWKGPFRDELYRSVEYIFSRPNEKKLDAAFVESMEREIETLDTRYLPGYKKLFDRKPFDPAFPELAAPPQDVLIVELLYRILFELRDQRRLSLLYWAKLFFCEKIPREAGKVAAFFRKLFGRGNGGEKRR